MAKSDSICVVEWGAITVLKFEENGLAFICEVPYKIQRNMEEKSNASRCLVTSHLVGILATLPASSMTVDK